MPSGTVVGLNAPAGDETGAAGGSTGPVAAAAARPRSHTGQQEPGQGQEPAEGREQVAPDLSLDLSWTHPLLAAMRPWLCTLTPLQLSGVGITVARLGAARRLFHGQLPGPQDAQEQGEGQDLQLPQCSQGPHGHGEMGGSSAALLQRPSEDQGGLGDAAQAATAAAAGAAAASVPPLPQGGLVLSAPGRLAPPPPPPRSSRPMQALALSSPAKLPGLSQQQPGHNGYNEAQLPPPTPRAQQQQDKQQPDPHVSFVSTPKTAPFLHAYCEAIYNTFVASQAAHTNVSIGNVCDVVRGMAAVQLPFIPHKYNALPSRSLFLTTAIVSYELTQQNGFAPPYVMQVRQLGATRAYTMLAQQHAASSRHGVRTHASRTAPGADTEMLIRDVPAVHVTASECKRTPISTHAVRIL